MPSECLRFFAGDAMSVGDCMPYVHDGRYHVLYLKDRHHHASKWGRGGHQWAHIYTVRIFDGSPAPLRRSVSGDGYHDVKDRDFSVCLSERYHAASARDPKVLLSHHGQVVPLFQEALYGLTNAGRAAHPPANPCPSWPCGTDGSSSADSMDRDVTAARPCSWK